MVIKSTTRRLYILLVLLCLAFVFISIYYSLIYISTITSQRIQNSKCFHPLFIRFHGFDVDATLFSALFEFLALCKQTWDCLFPLKDSSPTTRLGVCVTLDGDRLCFDGEAWSKMKCKEPLSPRTKQSLTSFLSFSLFNCIITVYYQWLGLITDVLWNI